MKIACVLKNNSAPYYHRKGLLNVFNAIGHSTTFWNPDEKSEFDFFDEWKPDILIGETYSVTESLLRCLSESRQTQFIAVASAWGPLIDSIDRAIYPIDVPSDNEKKLLERMKKEIDQPQFVFLHCISKYQEEVLGGWREIGIEPYALMNAADLFEYEGGQQLDKYRCDISFVGGFWGYKSQNIDKTLTHLLHPKLNYKVKIFGNNWPYPQCLGFLNENDAKHLFRSSTINLNTSEPHSTTYGYDAIERIWKTQLSGFCISDYVEGALSIFPNLPMYHDYNELLEMVQFYLKKPEKRIPIMKQARSIIYENHTYHHRCFYIFNKLGHSEEAQKCLDHLKDNFNE